MFVAFNRAYGHEVLRERRHFGGEVPRMKLLPSILVSGNLPFVATYRIAGRAALEALGDPTRRAIFESLVGRPKAVGELADELPVSRPAVSQHLKVLKQSKLVAVRADGTRRVYRVDPTGFTELREYLDRMWDRALTAFAADVEEQEAKRKEGQDHDTAG